LILDQLKGIDQFSVFANPPLLWEVAEDLFARGLCLPSGTAMTEEDLERVVSVIRKCFSTYLSKSHHVCEGFI
jgi:dTDP-4-amino-4,6-dideoxygalactose transaminase